MNFGRCTFVEEGGRILKMTLPLLCVFFLSLGGSALGENILGTANNGFAIDLYKELSSENVGKNLFFSPISIFTAFGLVNLGARGKSQTEVKQVLHLNNIGSDALINDAFKQLLAAFNTQNENHTLHVVNRLFGKKNFDVRREFLDDSEKYFQTSLDLLDFAGKPEESRHKINDWVADNTNRKIQDLFKANTISDATVLVIVNAVYFKALWKTPFDPQNTVEDNFRISKSETSKINMMSLSRKTLGYYNATDLGCDVVELQYRVNGSSMFLLIPHDVDGLAKVEAQLTADKLSQVRSRIQQKSLNLKFPKFVIDQDISLKKFLQLLGISDIFDPKKCDLSGMVAGGGIVVNEAVHKAHVNVTESGTEAAAATGIQVSLTSLRETITVAADRPFLFFILDKPVGSVLFMGRLVRPPVGSESVGTFGETAAQRSGSLQWRACGTVLWSAVVLMLLSPLL